MSSILHHFVSLSSQDKEVFLKRLSADLVSSAMGSQFVAMPSSRLGLAHIINESINHQHWAVFDELMPDFLLSELKHSDNKILVGMIRHIFLGNHIEAVQKTAHLIATPPIQDLIQNNSMLRSSEWCLPYLHKAFEYMDVEQLAAPLLKHLNVRLKINVWKKQFSLENRTGDERLSLLLLQDIHQDKKYKPFYFAHMLFNMIDQLSSEQVKFLIHHTTFNDIVLMGPSEFDYEESDQKWVNFIKDSHLGNLDLDVMGVGGFGSLYLTQRNRILAVQRLSKVCQEFEKCGIDFNLLDYPGIKKLLDNTKGDEKHQEEHLWLETEYDRQLLQAAVSDKNKASTPRKKI